MGALGFIVASTGREVHNQLNTVRSLDLRGQNWNNVIEGHIARFTTKKAAVTFAKQFGWTASDVQKGDNRFCTWWVIAQMQSTTSLTLLTQSGSTVEYSHFGYW